MNLIIVSNECCNEGHLIALRIADTISANLRTGRLSTYRLHCRHLHVQKRAKNRLSTNGEADFVHRQIKVGTYLGTVGPTPTPTPTPTVAYW
jgi:hypothetical protein